MVYFLYKVVITLGLWIKTLSVATQNESYGMLPSYSSVYYPVQESFFSFDCVDEIAIATFKLV